MKVRDSGMPEEAYWESLFDIDLILSELGINESVQDLAEFGSGYGTFSIPAAKIIKGTLFAFDIEPVMTERLRLRAAEENLLNIEVNERDFVKDGTNLPDGSMDYVMMFNILHAEDPKRLLMEAHRILKPGGKIGVIHWVYSESTPRGPSLKIRPRPEQCLEWLEMSGFMSPGGVIPLPPFHYGMTGIRNNA